MAAKVATVTLTNNSSVTVTFSNISDYPAAQLLVENWKNWFIDDNGLLHPVSAILAVSIA